MMHRFVISLLVFFPIVSVGQSDRTQLRYDKTYMLGRSDSDFVVMERNLRGKDKEDEIILHCYSLNLEKKWTIEDVGLQARFSRKNIFYTDGRVFMLSEFQNSFKLQHEYNIEHLIKNDGNGLNNKIPLFAVKEYDESKKLRGSNYEFDYRKSTSGKQVIFTYANNYTKEFKEGFQYRIMKGDSLSDIKSLELPYEDPMCNIVEYEFDDTKGNELFMLVNVFDVPSVNKRKIIRTELYRYNLDNNSHIVKEVPVDELSVDAILKIESGDIYIGFLFREKRETLTRGIKIHRYDHSLDLNHTFYQPYFYDLKDKQYYLKQRDYNPYSLVDFKVLHNKDIIAIGEKNNFKEKRSMVFFIVIGSPFLLIPIPINSDNSSEPFQSSSIMVSYLSPDTLTGFSQKIPKYQKDMNIQHVSHLLLPADTCAYIVYTRDSLRPNGKNADLVSYRVGKYGCMEETSLVLPEGSLNPRPKTGSYISLDHRNFVIAAADNRKNYLLKLNFRSEN